MTLPGSDPRYVLLWPLISASSLTPPRLILTNFLSSDLAIDFASEVLPTPGGPTRQRIGAFMPLDGAGAAIAWRPLEIADHAIMYAALALSILSGAEYIKKNAGVIDTRDI